MKVIKQCVECNSKFLDYSLNHCGKYCCCKCNDKRYANIKSIENDRRKKLNLPLIGEGYFKEIELLHLIRKIFPEKEIIIHSRKILGKWKSL